MSFHNYWKSFHKVNSSMQDKIDKAKIAFSLNFCSDAFWSSLLYPLYLNWSVLGKSNPMIWLKYQTEAGNSWFPYLPSGVRISVNHPDWKKCSKIKSCNLYYLFLNTSAGLWRYLKLYSLMRCIHSIICKF